ncbi:MAG TPA: oligosaccharide flippase family protein [Allosphingosinicella sp.]|nr:oligosaccharide flippase family protein [Allosphingosinicella sp.]
MAGAGQSWRSGATPYALATAATAAASVGGVILLTRLLAAEGYGLYAAIVGLVTIVQNAGYLALQASIVRFHARAADAEARRRLATALRIAFLAATLLVAALWALAVRWLGEAGVTAELAVAGLGLLVLRGWLSLVQAWNRAQGRSWAFFLLEAVQAFGAMILAVAALELAPGAPEAAVWGTAAACGLAAALSPALLVAPVRTAGTRVVLRELFVYGAPLALAFLAGAALAVSDRLIIAVHLGAAAAGAYAVAFAIADRAINLVIIPVPVAAKPALFAAWEQGGEAAARPVLERTARWLIVLGFPVATILIFAPEPIARLLAGGGLADEAARMIPWIAAGSLLSALLAHHFAIAFQLTRRTGWMLVAIGVPAALNIAANLILVPRYGMVAAGWTTVGGYALAVTLAVLIGRRHVRVPFPLRTAALTLLACVPLAALLRLAS